MWFLRLILLAWFPGVLHAAASCARPELTDGFLAPDLQSYPHESNVVYACKAGFKSPIGDWKGSSTCQDGKWLMEIFCIEEANGCNQPADISDANITYEATQKLFAEGSRLRYECSEGHVIEEGMTEWLITCEGGQWTRAPPCSRVSPACVIKKGRYTNIELLEDEHFKEGEIKSFYCGYENYEVRARCFNSEIRLTQCCYKTIVGTRDCYFTQRG